MKNKFKNSNKKIKLRKYAIYPSPSDFSYILQNIAWSMEEIATSGEDSILVVRTPNVKGPPIARVKLLLFPSEGWPLTPESLWMQVTGEQDYVTWECKGGHPEELD